MSEPRDATDPPPHEQDPPAHQQDPPPHHETPPPDEQGLQPSKQDPQPSDEEREGAYALLQRGHALIKSRHHAQAAIVLQRAALVEPGKGSILEPLGRAYHHSGQFERARETFEALLEVDPSAHWAHFALATSLRKLGRTDEARTHLRLAVALSPSSALYRQALARIEPPPKPDAPA
jgi:tetratricopeptide (TPR) repeat protein